MKALLALLVLTTVAQAEPLPSGRIGVQAGGLGGTGADAERLGFGYQVGALAAWQPMATERRFGWSAKWSFMYTWMFDAGAARVGSQLKALQMDLMLGVRVRPGTNPSRYLTFHAGAEMLRTDQVIPPSMHRAFIGGVASVGVDQYGNLLGQAGVASLEVKLSQIGTGPTTLALVLSLSKTGTD